MAMVGGSAFNLHSVIINDCSFVARRMSCGKFASRIFESSISRAFSSCGSSHSFLRPSACEATRIWLLAWYMPVTLPTIAEAWR
jgi:hypothetical protein